MSENEDITMMFMESYGDENAYIYQSRLELELVEKENLCSLPCNSFETCHLFRKIVQQQKQGPQQVERGLDCQIQGTYT